MTQVGRHLEPTDFTGDGRADVTVYRPSEGAWYANLGASWAVYQWGVSTDIPTPGDYDGDGRGDLAVYRPSTATWFIR